MSSTSARLAVHGKFVVAGGWVGGHLGGGTYEVTSYTP